MSNAGRCFPTAETHPTFQLWFVHSTLYIFPMIPFNLKDAGKQIHMCVRILWIYIKILKCFLTRWSAGVLFSPCNINIFLKCFPRELHCFYNRKIFEQMLFHFKLCWKWNQFFKMCFMGAVFPNLPEGEQGIKSASLKLRPQSGCAGVAGIFFKLPLCPPLPFLSIYYVFKFSFIPGNSRLTDYLGFTIKDYDLWLADAQGYWAITEGRTYWWELGHPFLCCSECYRKWQESTLLGVL